MHRLSSYCDKLTAMSRSAASLLFLTVLLAFPAAAQTADLNVSISDLTVTLSHDFSFRPAKTSRVYLLVRNNATHPPASVTAFVTFPKELAVTQPYPSCQEVEGTAEAYRCTFPNFGRDGAGSAYFDVLPAQPAPAVAITATADSSEEDWNPANNRVSLIEPVYDVHDLDIRISRPPDFLDADNRMIAEFLFTNVSDSPALEVSAEIITYPTDTDPSGASNGWTCKPSSTYRLLCTNHSIAPHTISGLRLPVRFAAHELRGAFATNVSQKPAPEFRMPFQSAQADADF
jgi:hypothetical protein